MAYPYQQIYQPQYTPQYQPQYQQTQGFSVRGVTSKEEAQAAQTDYFSLGLVMPDLAHGIVYLKKFNPNTGACDLIEFHRAEEKPPVQFATMDDLNRLKEEILKERYYDTNAGNFNATNRGEPLFNLNAVYTGESQSGADDADVAGKEQRRTKRNGA